ncbi:MAG: hypothetical protein PWQ51_633 [Methanolobus sp.]|jgi:hypothetical protein|uniref:DUF3303 domain-containing protein n=1 Tax=Methanolobus tindarius DSM 2278 TaxID=1090322 RepID=W9DRT0_METTI|nr:MULTISPECIES: DUF3303 family protein [Methanolobus]ETA68468.1 Protein of unknown function (DUF3303) [Methanolobus tindarius DSM 2278]MDI3485971.1 hypothetical protein [Methanolobus sp.]MDK2832412.1 hypothetical protein [Methanolobus sp.]MDK2938469.1 hypothetical protein [Methanolobus sp.]
MLFFDISTWDPQDNEKVIEHFKNLRPPAGITIINQWVDLNGGRYFILYEAENNEAYAEFNIPWSDVCLIDSVPVMESTDFIKLMISKGL